MITIEVDEEDIFRVLTALETAAVRHSGGPLWNSSGKWKCHFCQATADSPNVAHAAGCSVGVAKNLAEMVMKETTKQVYNAKRRKVASD